MVSAMHVRKDFKEGESYNPLKGASDKTSFGQTGYEFLTGSFNTKDTTADYARDTLFLRASKYIVEGEISPVDVPGLKLSSQITSSTSVEMRNKITDYFKTMDDNNDDKLNVYQAGSGFLMLNDSSNLSGTSGNKSKGGGLHTIYTDIRLMDYLKAGIHSGSGVMLHEGIIIGSSSNDLFKNNITTGDSRSGVFLYDKNKKQWVMIGVVSTSKNTYTGLSLVSMVDFNDYKKKYEHIQTNSILSDADLVQDKDNIINKSTMITIDNAYDMGHGGIVVVESGDVTIKVSGSLKKFVGFDIAKNTNVNLEVKADETIHKIGEGKLSVNTKTDIYI